MGDSKKILVTGAAGFVGSRFVESCSRNPAHQVFSVDHLEHFKSRPEHEGISFGEKIGTEDLFDFLSQKRPRFDAIVHLGAITDTTFMDRNELKRCNTDYSQKLWGFATETETPLVYASSAATFGDGEKGYQDNEDGLSALKPLNPYGDSKQLFDVWALEEEKKKRTPPAWVGFKFFNVYGFGERHKGTMASVVLHAFDQIRATGTVKLFKSHRPEIPHGEQKRDFIYVDDVVSALWFAIQKPIRRGVLNLGTGKARSFLDLVRPIFKSLRKPEKIEFIDMPPGLAERYQYFTEADVSRLRQEGFGEPFTPLEEGVARYVERLKACGN